jgi:hypothetical protein
MAPDREVSAPKPATPPEARAWVRAMYTALRGLGVPDWQACHAVAIAVLETGWGKHARGGNLGGVKCRRDIAEWYLRVLGVAMPWYRAAGHITSGDPPEVYYVAFPDAETFWRFWLARYVGAHPTDRPAHPTVDYSEAGDRFWRDDPTWIDALIGAGYRGSVTQNNPAKRAASCAGHQSLVRRVRRFVGLSP